MRRIAVLLMTMSALTVVCCGCAWKSNFDWCEAKHESVHSDRLLRHGVTILRAPQQRDVDGCSTGRDSWV